MQKQSIQTYWWIWWRRFGFLLPQRPIPNGQKPGNFNKWLESPLTVKPLTNSSPFPWRFYGYLVGAGCKSFGQRVQQQGGGMRELPNYTPEIKPLICQPEWKINMEPINYPLLDTKNCHIWRELPFPKHYFGYPIFFLGGVPITFEHAKRRYFCLRPCSSTAIYEQCIDSFSFSLYIEYIHSVKWLLVSPVESICL